ncbi:MAG: radical SAM protein [Verrucomicrobia bacterium]|nr:radical SAM protein [Verrucomicrobiota bacterium]
MPSSAQLDLVLVNPGNRADAYQQLGRDLTAIEPPVWAGLMAAFVRNKGFSVRIVDANAEQFGPQAATDCILDLNPRLVGVVVYGHHPSASTQVMPSAGVFCRALKDRRPDLPIIMLGGHVTALPERTMQEEVVDYVCGGEGLYTLQALLSGLRDGAPDLSKVPDLYYRENSVIRHTPAAPLVGDLDGEMPGIAWDLMPMQRYRAHNWHCFGHLDRRQPYASLYTTLGCPYHCTFCCIQLPFRSGERAQGLKETVNSYRFWSPRRIGEELEMLANQYGIHNVKFADEMFVLNQRHVEGICDEIIRRGLKLNIWAYARVDTVRDKMLEKLKRAGFNWLCFGYEAGAKRVRQDADKDFPPELILQTTQRVRDAGICIIANFLFGLPEDDLETMQATLDLALELNCEFANFYCAMAYPGSQLYQIAIKERWPLPKTWLGYSQHAVDTLPLPTRHLSGADVLRFRDHAFQAYFANPRYLEMIRQKFGEPIVRHLREMAGHKLERRFT